MPHYKPADRAGILHSQARTLAALCLVAYAGASGWPLPSNSGQALYWDRPMMNVSYDGLGSPAAKEQHTYRMRMMQRPHRVSPRGFIRALVSLTLAETSCTTLRARSARWACGRYLALPRRPISRRSNPPRSVLRSVGLVRQGRLGKAFTGNKPRLPVRLLVLFAAFSPRSGSAQSLLCLSPELRSAKKNRRTGHDETLGQGGCFASGSCALLRNARQFLPENILCIPQVGLDHQRKG